MILFKVKPGPKITSIIKKDEKKKPRVINAKEMNFKVMTNSLKMMEIKKKLKQWKTRKMLAWEKFEAKNNDNRKTSVYPTFLTLIQKSHKFEEP